MGAALPLQLQHPFRLFSRQGRRLGQPFPKPLFTCRQEGQGHPASAHGTAPPYAKSMSGRERPTAPAAVRAGAGSAARPRRGGRRAGRGPSAGGGGVTVDHEPGPAPEVAGEPAREAARHLGGEALGEDHEARPALGADRRHRVRREPFPSRRTTGVLPFPPQVRSVTGRTQVRVHEPPILSALIRGLTLPVCAGGVVPGSSGELLTEKSSQPSHIRQPRPVRFRRDARNIVGRPDEGFLEARTTRQRQGLPARVPRQDEWCDGWDFSHGSPGGDAWRRGRGRTRCVAGSAGDLA